MGITRGTETEPHVLKTTLQIASHPKIVYLIDLMSNRFYKLLKLEKYPVNLKPNGKSSVNDNGFFGAFIYQLYETSLYIIYLSHQSTQPLYWQPNRLFLITFIAI